VTTVSGGWPSQEEALALHSRLQAGDPLASSDLSVAYLDRLVAFLRAAHPAVEEQLWVTAAEDALLDLMRRPESYDPRRGPLASYLRMAASADLRNALAKQGRRRAREAPLEVVELSGLAGKYLREDETDPLRIVEREEAAMEAHSAMPAMVGGMSPDERAVFELMIEGERRTEVFAASLGLSGLPFPDQQREIKRVKDRIKRRVQRLRK
jgi:hypothetical protein